MTDTKANRDYKIPRLRASLIARDPDGRVLLLQHIRPHGRYRVLPGGGVDYGETIEQAAAREVLEELNAECEIDRLVAVGELFLSERHVVDFFYSGTIKQNRPFEILHSEGIGEAEWVSPDELEKINFLPPEVIPVIKGLDDMEKGEIAYLGRYNVGPSGFAVGEEIR